MVSRASKLDNMTMFLVMGLISIFAMLVLILVAALHFLLYNADFPISDKHKSFLCYIFGLAAVVTQFAGPWISYHMIIANGASIEKFITYVMDGNNTITKQEDNQSQELHMMSPPVRSPNNKAEFDAPLLIPAVKNGKLAVNYGKKITVCCAFTVIQIFVYLIGHLAGEVVHVQLSRVTGRFAIMGWSVFWVSVFKIFSASHRYSLTMAKLVLSQLCVLEFVFVAFGCVRGWPSVLLFDRGEARLNELGVPQFLYFIKSSEYKLCGVQRQPVVPNFVPPLYLDLLGMWLVASVINSVRIVMRNPMDKLYTVNSLVTKNPSYHKKV